jgi:hypothetical protein
MAAASYSAPPSAATVATAVWTDTTAGDFTVAASVGKSIMNGVSLGTGLTINNLTNAATSGDLTAVMKASVTTAATAATPTAAAVTGAVGSVTGNVGGNVVGNVGGSVASVTAPVAITSNRKKAAAITLEFTITSASTGLPAAGFTMSGIISKDGGAQAACTNAVTDKTNGQYQIVLTAAETNANNIWVAFSGTGATPFSFSFPTQP